MHLLKAKIISHHSIGKCAWTVQTRRKGDLRLVVMSATLDAAKFVTYFAGSKAAYLQVCLTFNVSLQP